MRIVLITGSRGYADRAEVEREVALALDTPILTPLLIEGECENSPDVWARDIARSLGAEVRSMPADWKRIGRGAGPKRNQEMVDLASTYAQAGCKVICLAFISPGSKGAADCLRRIQRAGLPVRVFGEGS